MRVDSCVDCRPFGFGPRIVAGAIALALLSASSAAWAVPISFTLDPPHSVIDVVVDVAVLGNALTAAPQRPGSLSTDYSGTLEVDLGLQRIAFPGGSTATADLQRNASNNPVNLSPAVGGGVGSAPADYAVRLNAPVDFDIPPIDIPGVGMVDLGVLTEIETDVALRNVVLDVTSGDLPLGFTTGQFDVAGTSVSLTGQADVNTAFVLQSANFVDFLVASLALTALTQQLPPEIMVQVVPNFFTLEIDVSTGFAIDLAGAALPNLADGGTLDIVGSEYLLEVPIEFDALADAPGIDLLVQLDVGFAGSLHARAPYQPVPEPSAWLLGLSLPVAWSWKRRLVVS